MRCRRTSTRRPWRERRQPAIFPERIALEPQPVGQLLQREQAGWQIPMKHGLGRCENARTGNRPHAWQLFTKESELGPVLRYWGAPIRRFTVVRVRVWFPGITDGATCPDQFFVSKTKMPKGVTAR